MRSQPFSAARFRLGLRLSKPSLAGFYLGSALALACSSEGGDSSQLSPSGAGNDRVLEGTMVEEEPDTSATQNVVATGAVGNSAVATSDGSSTFQELGDSTEGQSVSEETACSTLVLDPEEVVTEVPREVTTETVTEYEKPVALYIVLDNSLSMNDVPDAATGGANANGGMMPAGTGGADTTGAAGAAMLTLPAAGAGGAAATGGAATAGGTPTPATNISKWDAAVQALTDFVNDPGSAGIEVAIQYFNPVGVGAQADECDGSGHSQPAVPIGPLPDNAAAIANSLATERPTGFTPTTGSLIGGVDFCRTYEQENPDTTCVTVLVTDGAPNGCDLDSTCPGAQNQRDCIDPNAEPTLTAIAAAGLTDGITTFTVGMQGINAEGFALLDAIALSGGSDCTPGAVGDEACDVSETGAAGFLEALNTIRETVSVTETMTETVIDTIIETVVLPCDFMVPPPTTGEPIDENKVIVTIDLDEAGEEELFRADDVNSCAGDGWYLPDPSDPTLISACPTTCERITAATSAKVDVLLGCEDVLQ